MGRRKRKPPTRQAPPRAQTPGDAPRRPPTARRLRPWLLAAMVALFVARPLFPSESAVPQGDGLPMVMLWLVLAVVWLLGAIGRPVFRLRLGWTDAAVAALLGWHTLAAVWAAIHASPRPAVNALWEWLALGLAYLLARQLIVDRREARAVVAVMIALAVALSGYGLYQYSYELPATRAAFEADPEGTVRAAGLPFEPDSPEWKLFEDRLRSTEPFATFALANSLAGYLVPWLVALAGITAGGRLGLRRLWIPVVAAMPIAACLLLTKSRSGYVATAMGVVLVGLLCRDRAWRLGWKLPAGAAALGAVLVAGAVAVGGLDRQVLSEASKSLGYRLQYWQSSLRMIADAPLMGCGPGNFQDTYTAYKLPEASEEVADPHNFLVEVWATAGTPAMLALLAVLACFAVASVRSVWAAGVELRASPDDRRVAGVELREPPDDRGPGGSPTLDPGHPGFVFAGAGCGFLLAVPLGLLSAAPPGMAAVVLGLPLAAGCVALLAGWVDRGRLPPALPAVAAAALLLNLLAAGGIGFPGVAGSLWLLVALGLAPGRTDRPVQRPLPRIAATAMLLTLLALAAACYSTAYAPVLRCRGEVHSAWLAAEHRDPATAERHLRHAAEIDPRSIEPRQQLVLLAQTRWRQEPTDESLARFRNDLDRYRQALARLAPRSSRGWRSAGELYETLYAASGQQEDLRAAIDAYSRSRDLYPNHALCWAKLALAERAAGNEDAFRRAADRALHLHEQTPHESMELPSDIYGRLLPEQQDPGE